jgi:hypothetical protein
MEILKSRVHKSDLFGTLNFKGYKDRNVPEISVGEFILAM